LIEARRLRSASRARLVAAAGLLFVAPFLVAILLSQSGSSLTVLSSDGRRAVPLTMLNDQEYVSLDDLASLFQLAIHEDALGAVTATYKGKTIVLTSDQPLASVSGRLVSLPAAPTRGPAPGRRWLVPIEFVSRALALIYDSRLDLRKPAHLLLVGQVRVPRLALRYEPLGSAGRLTIDAAPRVMSTVAQDKDRLTIRFDADALDVPTPPLQPPAGSLIQNVRLVDPVTLAIDLTPRFGAFKASSQSIDNDTARLVIDLVAAQSEVAPPPAATQPPPSPPEVSALAPPAASIRTIALDPGHGGEDDGVKGSGGTKEKDITLAVARRVKAAIEARLGIRVLLTRDDDRSVPLDDRAAVANNNKADVFISLHANAALRPGTSGASILTAAFPPDAEHAARAAMASERLPTLGGGLREVELVPWNFAQISHIDRSAELAGILEQQLRDRIPLSMRPRDQAPLRVLESANMPAVLVELGYLSNPGQEKQLAGGGFQTAFVQALYDAVIKFRDVLDQAQQAGAERGGR
jgi:N-acetylmuramoyl-L-alanine amidase